MLTTEEWESSGWFIGVNVMWAGLATPQIVLWKIQQTKAERVSSLLPLNSGFDYKCLPGIPGWLSSLASAFDPGRGPGVPHRAPCMEPASPSACVSASLSLCLS